jgi:hypothetical protein
VMLGGGVAGLGIAGVGAGSSSQPQLKPRAATGRHRYGYNKSAPAEVEEEEVVFTASDGSDDGADLQIQPTRSVCSLSHTTQTCHYY